MQHKKTEEGPQRDLIVSTCYRSPHGPSFQKGFHRPSTLTNATVDQHAKPMMSASRKHTCRLWKRQWPVLVSFVLSRRNRNSCASVWSPFEKGWFFPWTAVRCATSCQPMQAGSHERGSGRGTQDTYHRHRRQQSSRNPINGSFHDQFLDKAILISDEAPEDGSVWRYGADRATTVPPTSNPLTRERSPLTSVSSGSPVQERNGVVSDKTLFSRRVNQSTDLIVSMSVLKLLKADGYSPRPVTSKMASCAPRSSRNLRESPPTLCSLRRSARTMMYVHRSTSGRASSTSWSGTTRRRSRT